MAFNPNPKLNLRRDLPTFLMPPILVSLNLRSHPMVTQPTLSFLLTLLLQLRLLRGRQCCPRVSMLLGVLVLVRQKDGEVWVGRMRNGSRPRRSSQTSCRLANSLS